MPKPFDLESRRGFCWAGVEHPLRSQNFKEFVGGIFVGQ